MRRLSLALALALSVLERDARAQACCAGSSALTPARLPESEALLFGAQAQVSLEMGRFSAHGAYVQKPPNAGELDGELDLYGAWRTPYKRLQLAALVPLVMTARSASGSSAVGGGLGDINLAARLDVLWKEQARWFPLGVAALGGVTLPTGSTVESAHQPFAVDATGAGSVDGTLGVSLEHAMGPWLFNAIALATLHAPRGLPGDAQETRAPGLVTTGAITYVMTTADALGALVSYRVEWDASIAGQTSKDSARRLTRVGLFGVHPWGARGGWRLTFSALLDLPIGELGQNELTNASLILGLQRGFE